MSIGFNIYNLTDPLKRNVLGDLYGIFEVGTGNFLLCALRKTEDNPDWAITAGLAPGKTLSLTAVAAQLFEGTVTVPEGIPDFAFSVLEIGVVPSKQSFRFDAQSATPGRSPTRSPSTSSN